MVCMVWSEVLHCFLWASFLEFRLSCLHYLLLFFIIISPFSSKFSIIPLHISTWANLNYIIVKIVDCIVLLHKCIYSIYRIILLGLLSIVGVVSSYAMWRKLCTFFSDNYWLSTWIQPRIVVGYIWVGDQIYCVQHARELTRPPGDGYTAYVIDAPDGM